MSLRVRAVAVFDGVGVAMGALRLNKVRAALTIMGVAVGVFVVVALSAVVNGINTSFARDVEAAGPTSFWVTRREVRIGGCDGTDERCPDRRNPSLTTTEADALERLSIIQGVTSHIAMGALFKNRDREINAAVEVYTPSWTEIDGGDIDPGRNFTTHENEAAARVVIINEKLADYLFGDSDPIEKQVLVNGIPMRVIGIYKYTASPMGTPTSAGGGNDPKAILPYETARRQLKAWMGSANFIVKPRPGVTLDEAMDEVIVTLRTMRGLKPRAINNFGILTQDRLLEIYDSLFGTFFLAMIALSSVGLMVGGVGVVAIMMISVTERTREIGVRKALGATKATILWQFLVEAVTLTGIGASLGLAAGIGTAYGVKHFFPAIPASTPVNAIIAALAASALTGVLFGILPAIRAARLDPIEALRHE